MCGKVATRSFLDGFTKVQCNMLTEGASVPYAKNSKLSTFEVRPLTCKRPLPIDGHLSLTFMSGSHIQFADSTKSNILYLLLC